ncbi:MAG: HNH endonuclease [Chitinivibrionia bacterium]|nr:HNH endonuclease [Chitinivibrionia bacterium]
MRWLTQGAHTFENVLLLNASFEPLKVINWKKALKLVFLGKVEVVEESDESVHSISFSIKIPSVVRLLRFVGFKKREIKFSRQNIYARDRFQCQYCGEKLSSEDLTYDHITPRSRGGKTEWSNIVTCCIPCNRQKGGRTPEEADLSLIKKPSKPIWLWGFHSRYSLRNTPESWRDYIYWNIELVD